MVLCLEEGCYIPTSLSKSIWIITLILELLYGKFCIMSSLQNMLQTQTTTQVNYTDIDHH